MILHGSKAIGAFYRNSLGRAVQTIIPISFIAGGNECIMELAAVTKLGEETKYKLDAIDHFTMDEQGKIKHMVVFLRPDGINEIKKVN
jgi:hypothetical protein